MPYKTLGETGTMAQSFHFNVSNDKKQCCSGTVGRSKTYSNGYRFEYTRPGSRLKPYPQCTQYCVNEKSCPKSDSNLNNAGYDSSKYEWTNNCTQTESMRPPVF